jgi:hypothetical protein
MKERPDTPVSGLLVVFKKSEQGYDRYFCKYIRDEKSIFISKFSRGSVLHVRPAGPARMAGSGFLKKPGISTRHMLKAHNSPLFSLPIHEAKGHFLC